MKKINGQKRLKEAIGYLRRAAIMLALYQLHSYLYNYVGTHAVADNFNLMTAFDHLFPFVPWMVYPYMSLYLGVFLAAVFLKKRNFMNFVGMLVFTELLTYPVFYFFPAVYPMPHFEANNFTTRFLQWCFQADVHNNTFPSLHVSLALGTALIINKANRKAGLVALVWAVVVAFSTVLVKKHFFIDILGGMLVAQLAYSIAVKNELAEWFLQKAEQSWRKLSFALDRSFTRLNAGKYQSSKALTLLLIFFGLK